MANEQDEKLNIWDKAIQLFSPDTAGGSAFEKDIAEAESKRIEDIPTIWLLGKTGAGKSSFVKALTRLLDVEIGNGFKPCTRTTNEYLYPEDDPVLRILDTRGLGEAGYDHNDDLTVIAERADLVLVIAKVDEPEQSDITEAIKSIRNTRIHSDLLVLHTASRSVDPSDAERMIARNTESFDKVWKQNISHFKVDFGENAYGMNEVFDALTDVLPVVKLKLENDRNSTAESKNFGHLQTMVYSYSGTAALSAAIPAVGPSIVLAVQGKMMADIADHMEMEWDRDTLLAFLGILGTSFVLQQLALYGVRTLISAIPWVGSAVNATLAFGTTYAFGRATAYYLYKEKNGQQVSSDELRAIYISAFERSKQAKQES